jgi:hypothetical protein
MNGQVHDSTYYLTIIILVLALRYVIFQTKLQLDDWGVRGGQSELAPHLVHCLTLFCRLLCAKDLIHFFQCLETCLGNEEDYRVRMSTGEREGTYRLSRNP